MSSADVVSSLCGPTVNPRIGMLLGARHHEDQGAHLRA
jgi:hypothetical protein